MSISQMRAELLKLYASASWRHKVMTMPDYQVLAIYRRQILNKAR